MSTQCLVPLAMFHLTKVSDDDFDDDDDCLGKGECNKNAGQVDHDDSLGQGEGKMKERQEDSGAPRESRPFTCPREARRHRTGRTGLACVFLCIIVIPPLT